MSIMGLRVDASASKNAVKCSEIQRNAETCREMKRNADLKKWLGYVIDQDED